MADLSIGHDEFSPTSGKMLQMQSDKRRDQPMIAKVLGREPDVFFIGFWPIL